jgi:hypothetical protein
MTPGQTLATCCTIEEDKARQHSKKNGFAFLAVLTPTLDPLLLLPPVLSTNKQSDLKGPKLEVAPGFLHKSDLYGLVT